jgi:uncharacterized protein YoxC
MAHEKSVALVALSFSCLVFYGIRTLQKAMVSLEETNQTLTEVRKVAHTLTKEAVRLIHTASDITADVKSKIESVEPLIDSAHDVGEILHQVTEPIKQAAIQSNQHLVPPVMAHDKVHVRVGQNGFST